jgi:hypothetical protein
MCLWTALLLIATTARSGGVQVASQVDCPDSGSVASRLASMLAPAAFPGHRLWISARPAVADQPVVLILRLADAQGTVVGERDWPRSSDCRAAADEVAVVAATWLTALPPPVLSALPPPQPDRSATAAPATRVVVNAQPSPVARRSTLAVGLGAGWAFTPDGQSVPTATLRAEGQPSRFPSLLWSVGFIAAGSWQQPLEEGQVSWRRWMGVMELGVRVGWRRLVLATSGGIEAGALSFRGSAFPRPESQIEPEIAACSTTRVAWALGGGPLAPRVWVAGRLTASVIRYHARIQDADGRRAISWFQAAPLLGVDFPLPF